MFMPSSLPAAPACGRAGHRLGLRARGATGAEGTSEGCASRPFRTWQVNALPSCMLTLGSLTIGSSSLAALPVTSPA